MIGAFATYQKMMWQRLRCALPFLLLCYFLMSPIVAMPLYNKILFFPLKQEPDVLDSLGDVPNQEVFLNVDKKTKICCWHFAHPQPKGMIVFCHGNGGNLMINTHMLKYLIQKGYSVFAFDYEGYGSSDGEPSLDGICRDSLVAFDYARSKTPESLPIILYGESLGGGVAGYIAKKRKVDAIILQSTFSSLPEIAAVNTKVLFLYPPLMFPSHSLDTSSVLKKPHAPTLILHGTADGTVDCGQSRLLFKNAIAPVRLAMIPDAGHGLNFPPSDQAFDYFVTKFLDDFHSHRLTAHEDVSEQQTPHQ